MPLKCLNYFFEKCGTKHNNTLTLTGFFNIFRLANACVPVITEKLTHQ